jgi:hypothetical protein
MTVQPDPGAMPATTAAAAASAPPTEKLNFAYHAVIGVAIGVVSLFTLWAWPFAILTGIVIGKAGSDRRLGRKPQAGAVQVLAVTGGVAGMMLAGIVIGGLISFLVVGLAAFSERVAENTRPVDQTMARILITVVAVAIWFLAFFVLRLNINVTVGG